MESITRKILTPVRAATEVMVCTSLGMHIVKTLDLPSGNRVEFTRSAVKHYRDLHPGYNVLVIAEEKDVLVSIPKPLKKESIKLQKTLKNVDKFNVYVFIEGTFTHGRKDNLGDWAYEGEYIIEGLKISFHAGSNEKHLVQPGVKPAPGNNWVYVAIKGSNGKYVTSGNGLMIACNRSERKEWERWLLIFDKKGVSIRSHKNNFISSENGKIPMNCNRKEAKDWEHFTVTYIDDTCITIQGSNGKFVSTENGKPFMMCNRKQPEEWEVFTLEPFPEEST